MPDEMSPEVARAEIDRLRGSDEVKNVMHPSHERALQSLAEMYAKAHPEPSEEVEGATKEASEVHENAIETDDPEQAAIQEALQPLRDEWRGDFDKNIAAAQGLVEHMTKEMGTDVAEVFDTIGNSPRVIRALYDWSQGRDGGDLTPDDAKAIIGLIQKSEVYQRGISQTSEVLRNVMAALYQAAYK
jgi:chemotaxis regulatin CheY-phosphate phosphatase CheZ